MRKLRLPAILCASTLLICAVITTHAADFKTVGLAGNQRVRISGTINPGDQDKLRDLLRRSPTYPDGVLIDSPGGDPTASIAIGQLIRDAMLPVTAERKCDGECVLIWIAGTRRATRTALDPSALSSRGNEIRVYLSRMEVDDETTKRLLESPSPLSPVQALELLGVTSPDHESRLAERCGALTQKEVDDWRAVQSLASVESSLNAMSQGMGSGQAMYVVDPETERRAAAARDLPPDYRRELKTRQAGIEQCRREAVAEWRVISRPQPSRGR